MKLLSSFKSLFSKSPAPIRKLNLIELENTRPKKKRKIQPTIGTAYYLENNVSIFADIVQTMNQETFRRGFSWKPIFVQKCAICGTEYDEIQAQCDCGSTSFTEPDKTQLQLFDRPDGTSFLEQANLNDLSLKEELRDFQRNIDIADKGFLLCVKKYIFDEVNIDILLSAAPVELISLDPRDIEPIERENGLLGGEAWICLLHRDNIEQEEGHVCKICGRQLYEAHFKNNTGQYYVKGEVLMKSLYYKNGYPPILKFVYDAYAYLHSEQQTYNYFKRGRGKQLFIFPTNNLEGLDAFWQGVKQKWDEDPDELVAIGNDSATKSAAQVLELMKAPGPELIEVKKELRERLGSMFGVSLIFQGDTSASGGLNNEGLQITVTNRGTEFRQGLYNGDPETNYGDGVLRWICRQFGITDFVLQLNPSEEQDEMSEKQRFNQDATNAKLMLDMGFDVKFENNKFTFSGQAQRLQAPQPVGFPPAMPSEPRVSGAPLDVHKCACDIKKDLDEFDELNQDELVKSFAGNALQAIKAGALYPYYKDVDASAVPKIHDIIKQAFLDKRLSMRDMTEKIMKETGLDQAKVEMIVRTETSAIANKAREIGWNQMEKQRGEEFLYKWNVHFDDRTSDICSEIADRVGSGKTMDELKRIVKEVSQSYIPGWMGWEQLVAHPNERSTVTRKIL